MDSTVTARHGRSDESSAEISLIIERLLRELMDDAESVGVTFTQAGSLLLIEVVPSSPRAAGQLIGRNGRTIAALRTLATAICAKYGWRAQLEIVA